MVAKELIKLAKMLSGGQEKEQDLKLNEMLKDIINNKSKLSKIKMKKCDTFKVTGQIGKMTVQELIASLHKIITSE